MSKLIAVFGATGNQGGSVIRAILLDPILSQEFRIRGITRDVDAPAAKELIALGVEVAQADMSNASATTSALLGAHTVFLMTNFWETMSAEVEISQGKTVVDAAKQVGVKHLIFSTLIDANVASNGKLPNISHFDGKARIEAYIRSSGVPATFILPGMFMADFFSDIQKQDDGSYTLVVPEGTSLESAQLPLLDVISDAGKFVLVAIRHFPVLCNERLYAASDYYSLSRILSEFSEVIHQPAHLQIVSQGTFKLLQPPAAAQDLLENWLLLETPGYYGGADISESLLLLEDQPTTWKHFVEQNIDKWL